MTPYADFAYFGLLLYPALPAVALGLIRRLSRSWILIGTAIMLLVQYGSAVHLWPESAVPEIALVAGYALVQWIVAAAFLWARPRTRRRWPFYGALALAIAPLAGAKLLPPFASGDAVGFLGISYVTFRSLDVMISIQDKLITSLSAPTFLAYLLFFPTISSGPIDRYRRFLGDWNRTRSRSELLEDLDGAMHQIFTGFLYKFILAALIKRYWLDPAGATEGLGATISYMYAYSFYLFFDFAGYSAFAVGASYLFGIHTPPNFDRPFLAHDIRDFWNRWHVSLSAWFRDHVYMRFVMAATRGKWFKSRYTASYLGFFLSMGLMGLWHGTAWHYLLYGLYHGALLSGTDVVTRWNKQHQRSGSGRLWRAGSVCLTFNLVCFGLLLFSGRLG